MHPKLYLFWVRGHRNRGDVFPLPAGKTLEQLLGEVWHEGTDESQCCIQTGIAEGEWLRDEVGGVEERGG